ncbi:MAG TPA: hypothetical protein VH796_02545 [Nitrososphaeraceae archaeon]|jgi:hypothetical protein
MQAYNDGFNACSSNSNSNDNSDSNSGDSNSNSEVGNNFDQQSSSHTSLGDTVCNLVNSGKVDALGAILAPLHVISGGTTAGILAAGHFYCALHGSGGGNYVSRQTSGQ